VSLGIEDIYRIRDQGIVGPVIGSIRGPWQVFKEIVKGIKRPALKENRSKKDEG
jgi:hypothetical protein